VPVIVRVVWISRGSVVEVQSLLYVACDVGVIDQETVQPLSQMADETSADSNVVIYSGTTPLRATNTTHQ
jgi:hypothetical protein